jgi:hypothetical protein
VIGKQPPPCVCRAEFENWHTLLHMPVGGQRRSRDGSSSSAVSSSSKRTRRAASPQRSILDYPMSSSSSSSAAAPAASSSSSSVPGNAAKRKIMPIAPKKKMTIKPFKVKPQLPQDFEEKNIEKLQKAVRRVFENCSVPDSQEELYRVRISLYVSNSSHF